MEMIERKNKSMNGKIAEENASLWINEEERFLELLVNKEALEKECQLDGCYVIKTDLQTTDASKETVYERYKDLSLVENAFRTFKTGWEEIRPIHLRKEKRTRGHVFVCMLAYKILLHIWQYFLFTGKPRNTFT